MLNVQYTGSDYYIDCSKKNGCPGIINKPDKKCIEENKEDILRCCLRSCIPTKDLDCNQYCEYMNKALLQPKNTYSKKILKTKLKEYTDYTWYYIFGGIFVSIIIIFLQIFIRNKI